MAYSSGLRMAGLATGQMQEESALSVFSNLLKYSSNDPEKDNFGKPAPYTFSNVEAKNIAAKVANGTATSQDIDQLSNILAATNALSGKYVVGLESLKEVAENPEYTQTAAAITEASPLALVSKIVESLLPIPVMGAAISGMFGGDTPRSKDGEPQTLSEVVSPTLDPTKYGEGSGESNNGTGTGLSGGIGVSLGTIGGIVGAATGTPGLGSLGKGIDAISSGNTPSPGTIGGIIGALSGNPSFGVIGNVIGATQSDNPAVSLGMMGLNAATGGSFGLATGIANLGLSALGLNSVQQSIDNMMSPSDAVAGYNAFSPMATAINVQQKDATAPANQPAMTPMEAVEAAIAAEGGDDGGTAENAGLAEAASIGGDF